MNKEKSKKINKAMDTTGLIIICATVVLLNFFIGANLKSPLMPIQLTITIYTAIYIVIKKIVTYNNIIFKGKIDIAVTIMMVAVALPLLIGKSISIMDSYIAIQKYLSIFSLYILCRNIINTSKEIKIVINTFIFSSIIVLVFGFDKLNTNIFLGFLDNIDSIKKVEEGEWARFVSTFGYANTAGLYLSSITFLAISQLIENKNKYLKAIYASIINVQLIAIFLTSSRSVIILFVTSIIMLIALIKDKGKRIVIISQMFVSVSTILIYYIATNIFNVIQTNYYLLVMAGIIIYSFIINLKSEKKMNKLAKINKKYLVILLLVIIALLGIYTVVALQYSKPISIKNEKSIELRNLNIETDYIIELEIQSNLDTTQSIPLKIKETNRYLKEIELISDEISGNETKKEYKIKTSENMTLVKLYFSNKTDKNVKINKIKINGKEYIANYKYIPNFIGRLATTLNSKSKSLWQRQDFYKDAIKIATNSLIFGQGGNAWKYAYSMVQEYSYISKEVHSYLFEILISYGITGILAFASIIIITLVNVYKFLKKSFQKSNEKNESYICILIATAMIIIHSIFDFDMSFLIMLASMYIFIAIINNFNDNNQKMRINIFEVVISIIILISAILNILNMYAKTKISDEKIYNKTYEQIYWEYSEALKYYPINKSYKYMQIDAIYGLSRNPKSESEEKELKSKLIALCQDFLKTEPNYEQNHIYNIYFNTILEELNKDYESIKVSELEFIYDCLKKGNSSIWDFEGAIERQDLIVKLRQWIKENSN